MKRITVRASTTVRRSGSHIVATTRVSNGKSTRTVTKRVRVGRYGRAGSVAALPAFLCSLVVHWIEWGKQIFKPYPRKKRVSDLQCLVKGKLSHTVQLVPNRFVGTRKQGLDVVVADTIPSHFC